MKKRLRMLQRLSAAIFSNDEQAEHISNRVLEESVLAERRALKEKVQDNVYEAAEDLTKLSDEGELEALRSRMDLVALPGLDDNAVDPLV